MKERPFATVREPTRLRPGDVIEYAGRPCKVVSVTPCCAVVRVTQPPRKFTTKTGRTVTIRGTVAFERISANSTVPILTRKPLTP